MIKALGVMTIELAHAACQVAINRLHQQMIVIAHLAKRMDYPIKPLTHSGQHGQPILAIGVAQKNIFTPISTRSDVVKRPSKFKS